VTINDPKAFCKSATIAPPAGRLTKADFGGWCPWEMVARGWTRADWDWVHEPPDPHRWDDAPVLLAYPPASWSAPYPPPPDQEQYDEHVLAWIHHLTLSEKLILERGNPMETARVMLDTKHTDWDNHSCRELRKLHRHRGSFWRWTGSFYESVDEEIIHSEFWRFLETAWRLEKVGTRIEELQFKPIQSHVINATAALTAVAQLEQHIEPPAWLAEGSTDERGWLHLPNGTILILPRAEECVACGNGLLHLPTGELYDPTPDFFNLTASTVEFDPDAAPPTQWLAFLDQVFGDDTEAIGLLQEWFGYVLSPDMSQQKILLVVGPKRSGKGTVGRILTALLGKESVGAPTMSNLAETFGLETLTTRSLAIVSDARIGARTDKSAIVERLLSFSGEDSLSVPRKYKADWTGRLPTRFMILTNLLPSLSDDSGALANRFVILVLTKSFFGKEDPSLTGKLLTELSGIMNWAIEGYRRLRNRGYFVQPTSSLQAVEDIEVLASPVKAWVRDRCHVGPLCKCPSDLLWGNWQAWSDDQGRPDPGTKQWFFRNLQSVLPGLTTTRPVNNVGERKYWYVGIALIGPDHDQHVQQWRKTTGQSIRHPDPDFNNNEDEFWRK
jgi:putative DNA primase/helicase